jgi:hypothetical protein
MLDALFARNPYKTSYSRRLWREEVETRLELRAPARRPGRPSKRKSRAVQLPLPLIHPAPFVGK